MPPPRAAIVPGHHRDAPDLRASLPPHDDRQLRTVRRPPGTAELALSHRQQEVLFDVQDSQDQALGGAKARKGQVAAIGRPDRWFVHELCHGPLPGELVGSAIRDLQEISDPPATRLPSCDAIPAARKKIPAGRRPRRDCGDRPRSQTTVAAPSSRSRAAGRPPTSAGFSRPRAVGVCHWRLRRGKSLLAPRGRGRRQCNDRRLGPGRVSSRRHQAPGTAMLKSRIFNPSSWQ